MAMAMAMAAAAAVSHNKRILILIYLKRMFMNTFKRIESPYFARIPLNHPSTTAWLAAAGLVESSRIASELGLRRVDVVAQIVLPLGADTPESIIGTAHRCWQSERGRHR